VSEQFDDDFADFVHRWSPALLRVAFLLTSDHGLAEDLLQTALMKTSRRWRHLPDRDHAYSYVRRVLVTTHTSWYRRRRIREVLVDQWPDVAAAGSGGSSSGLGDALVALNALPPRMRAVIVLRFYEDLSEADTATALGCSLGTVKSQSSRGLARLRDLLDTPTSTLR
jgi:RNA polymerase sigma-70 factor (sigma-E family)